MAQFDNRIGGAAVGTTYVANINPSDTSDIIGHYASGTAQDVNLAVVAARTAFDHWSRSDIHTRHAILRRAADEIFAREEELGTLLSREEGKPLADGIGEVRRAAQFFDFYAGEALRMRGECGASLRPGVGVEVARAPLGVIGLITPWNFPMAIPAWKIAPALCYGNAVVFKPAELVPGCAWELVDILHRAGLPDGVVNLVMGKGSQVGQAMLDAPEIDAISFTGSCTTGALVAASSAKHMRRFQLEMGGKNPLVVLDDANLEIAVECALNGAYNSAGQKCTASSRFIVTKGIHDRFVDRLSDRLRAMTVSNAVAAGTDIGPLVSAAQLSSVLSFVQTGKAEGATLVTGGEPLALSEDGFYMSPALFINARPDMVISQEEIFGPVACVIKAEDYAEALKISNDTRFGLSAGICTTSLEHATHFKANAQAGMITVNLPTAGADFHAPFGGTKSSSFGPREQGQYAIDFYTVTRTSYTRAHN